MAAGSHGGGRSLEITPTWALAAVLFVFISIGLFIEHLIHLASHWLRKHKKASLCGALEKLESLLMQLGFMSLILTVTQPEVSKICIPYKAANFMLPCQQTSTDHLPASAALDHCSLKGMVPVISADGVNQLNIFIFVLAAMQVVYSLTTLALARAKIKTWKAWEEETQTVEYMVANDPERFRVTRTTTFSQRHAATCASTPALLWAKCFFRQFFRSVAKVDYLTLRHGFISAHLQGNNTYNFQRYITRSLEDDFKSLIGIRPVMWLMVVIFMLVDVHGWNVYLWVSFVPLIIALVVGTKLEAIMGRMAKTLTDEKSVIKGAIVVHPDDHLFWFNSPRLVLTLLHFILIMNSFEFSFFIWVSWQFGINSCYQQNVGTIVTRLVLVVVVQVLCSYITLPLYALVTQMGSEYKMSLLEEDIKETIKHWHQGVKHKRKRGLGEEGEEEEGSSHSWRGALPARSPPFTATTNVASSSHPGEP